MPDSSAAASSGVPAQNAPPVQQQQQAPVMQVQVSQAEKSSFVMRLIGQYGSAENALTAIAGKQIHYQKRAQEAERQTAEARKLVPPADAVVLTGDQAKAFKELKEKGVTLDKVPSMLADFTKLAAEQSAASRTLALQTAAGSKYKQKVLALLVADKPLEFKDIMVKDDDGKTKIEKVAYIKNGETLEPLDTWLEREHADSLDVLVVDPNATSGASSQDGSAAGTSMPPQSRTPTQGSAGTPTNNAIVDQTLKSKYSTPAGRRQQSQQKQA